jgi:fermentation-respiration switch protein FrsA (DUF1100 family)
MLQMFGLITKKLLWLNLIFFILIMLGLYGVGSVLIAPHNQTIQQPTTTLPVQTLSIQTSRGNHLAAWYVVHPKATATHAALLMHGAGSNRLQMLQRAQLLYNLGYNVLMFDFQGHGESLGQYVTYGYLESQDATSAFDYLKQLNPQAKLLVIGVSLGGASALLSPVIRQQADALVLESVYSDLPTAIFNRLQVRLGKAASLAYPLLAWQLPLRLGFKAADLSPLRELGKVKMPVMIMNGAIDTYTSVQEAQSMYQALQAPKKLIIVPNAGHLDLYAYNSSLYEPQLKAFLQEVLP